MKKIFVFLIVILCFGLSSCFSSDDVITDPDTEKEKIEELFRNNPNYLGENYDYQVLSLALELEKYGMNYLITEEYKTHICENILKKEYTYISEAYKDALILSKFEIKSENLEVYLNSLTFDMLQSWDYCNAYMALKLTSVNETLKNEIKNNVLKQLEEKTLYLDADTAAQYIYSGLFDDKISEKDYLMSIINSSIKIDGVESYGNVNSCSTAQVVLALLSENICPTDYEFDQFSEKINLIKILDSFKCENGYKWLLGDENADYVYATPQVIFALGSFYIYQCKENEKVNILA